MIIGIVGELGCGKTLLLTHLGKLMHDCGYTVYSNYKLNFPHNLIDEANILSNLTKESKNIFLFDELWLTADSRKSMSLSNFILSSSVLQSRKLSCDIFYTTQHSRQVDIRIRNVTNLFFRPSILFNINNIPFLIIVKVFKRDFHGILIPRKTFYVNVLDSLGLYDTSEIILPSEHDEFSTLIERYKNFSGKKTALKSLLIIKEGLSGDKANTLASYIVDVLKKNTLSETDTTQNKS
jgi:ABC-type dipeptide/oligopeptide/nickel transport system ATPase component